MRYFVVWAWQGKFHCFKTDQAPLTKPDPMRVGVEVERYILSDVEAAWSLSDLMRAREFNELHKFTQTAYQREAFWDTLGLPDNATKKEVASKFRELALKHHPDVGGTARTFIKLRQAYEAAMRWFERRKVSA